MRLKMQLILFGLSGSGKNYVGEIFAKHFEFYFWDADTVLPAEMRECINRQETFTQSMRDNFTAIIIHHINELKKLHPKLVIAQAFYKEQNRIQIKTACPTAQLVYIQAQPALIATRLSKNHADGYLDYAEKIRLNFETPQLVHKVIINESDEAAVIKQIETLFTG
jgi:gluconokinase